MKQSEFKNIKKEESNISSLLSSNQMENSIKSLSIPSFLGSLHMKNTNSNPNFSSVDNLLKGELELKLNKALKNTLLNPITKILIFAMILANLFWVIFFYIL